MTYICDDPARFKDDMIDGFVSAYSRYVQRVPSASGVMRVGGARRGKVSVVVGGGSGHYPAFCGVVGQGLADGAVIGDIFTSPSTEQAYRVAKALDGGAGVLFSFGNYAGDVMNFGAAQQRLRAEGIDCRTVLVTDDIASANSADAAKRRGIAGDFFVFKLAGAAADRGRSIDEVERVARKCNEATRSFGVAFAGCTFPGRSTPLFTVDPGRMDLGLGIHGEPGIRSVELLPAHELAETLVKPLLEERPAASGNRVAVLVNGLGATKYEELFVLYKSVLPALRQAGLEVVHPEVGELVTSLDMAGCSVSLLWLDEELEELWTAPADTPAFRKGEVSGLPSFERVTEQAVDTADETSAPLEVSAASRRAGRTAREILAAMLAVVADNEQELGRIDAVAGDGDHGSGMVRGLRGATSTADAAPGGAGSVLDSAGLAWADKAGGTSGMLWGALLQTIGTVLGDTETPTSERIVEGIRQGADAIQRLGKAQLGDKTMLDALIPFTSALGQEVSAGKPLAESWRAAAAVATEAAAATAELVPKVGRARPLAERSLGTPDAGAISMALCVTAAADVIDRNSTVGEAK